MVCSFRRPIIERVSEKAMTIKIWNQGKPYMSQCNHEAQPIRLINFVNRIRKGKDTEKGTHELVFPKPPLLLT